MKKLKDALQRPLLAVVAFAFVLAAATPALLGTVFAYGQVTTRSIKMSDATAGASGVSYEVTFTPATTATTIQAIAVDFCANSSSPIAGDTCTAPTGFSVGTPTVTGTTVTGQSGGTWTAAAANTGRTLELTNGSSTGTPSGAVSFTLTTATNPTTPTGTFYARVMTFAATADVDTWDNTADGSATGGVVDFGGFALTTTVAVTITAKVQETLTFCVSGTDISASDCSSATAPAKTIGHAVGSNTILSDTAVDTISDYTQLSTNALNGAVIRIKNTNGSATCAGLSNNGGTSCDVPSVNSGCTSSCTATAIIAGTAAFGMCLTPESVGVADAPYDDLGCTAYGLDDNAIDTYGSTLYHTPSAANKEDGNLKFAATAALTTPAGIYTATYSLIATSTF